MNTRVVGAATAAAAWALLSAAAPPQDGSSARSVELAPRAYRTWDIWLPAQRFAPAKAGFRVAHAGGEKLAVEIEGSRLRADLDGDGKLEALVEGESAFLTFSAPDANGRALQYSVRLEQRPDQGWVYTCGGAMSGTFGSTRLQLIDQNLNGRFDDFGEDALVVGNDSAASLLSRVVSLEGALYELAVAPDGRRIDATPYTGLSGVLDLASQFTSKAKLTAAVVQSVDGRYSFSLAKAKSGLSVPAGEYRLVGGALAQGDSRAELRAGRARTITVNAGATEAVAWGGPVSAEFAFERSGDQLTFTPWDIWFHGRLGEEYANFLPLGKSPDFAIADASTGEVLVNAKFPGNC